MHVYKLVILVVKDYFILIAAMHFIYLLFWDRGGVRDKGLFFASLPYSSFMNFQSRKCGWGSTLMDDMNLHA